MNKQTKALKMAIEAMENCIVYCENLHHAKKDRHKYSDPCPVEQRWNATIKACKEALAQPQSDEYTEGYQQGYVEGWEAKKAEQPAQEPYAWEINHLSATSPPPYIVKHKPFYKNDSNTKVTPLYTQPAPQPAQEHCVNLKMDKCEHKNICKHCEQPAQEPVAWMEIKEDAGYKEIKVWQEPVSKQSIPLYTHPAPSWQGLNEYRHLKWCIEQYRDCVGFEQKSSKFQSVCEALEEVNAIEQALKEKNA